MSSTRGARPFVPDAYRDDDDVPTPAVRHPHEPDDRAYIVLMYEEHAAQARQHETLRHVWIAFAMTAIMTLMVIGQSLEYMFLCGVLLVCTGLFSALAIAKFRERYELHLRVMRAFRNALAEGVAPEIPKISFTARLRHNREHRVMRLFSLQILWIFACLVGAGLGGGMVLRSFSPDALPMIGAPASQPQRPPVQPRGANRQEIIPVPPGSELP